MAHISFLDETMRDGQQSLWGMRMQAGMAYPVIPAIDRTGYSAISLAGSSLFEVLVRHCHEDPWAGFDLMKSQIKNTPVRGGIRSNGSVTFGFTPEVLMDLWMERLCEHGVRSWWIYDVLFNVDKMARLARLSKRWNCKVAGTMLFTLSPVHDDDFWADKADKLSAIPEVDSLLLYDTGGVLDRSRIETLVPAIVANSRGKPIELHSNNMLGQSAKAYCDAVEFGVTVLHTAAQSMANGPSIPSIDTMVKNMDVLGHSHEIQTSELKPVSDRFRRVAEAAGYLHDQHYDYDISSLHSQVPGGMMGTLLNQLQQQNMLDKLPAVLQEVGNVRRELGFPAMATPFAQLIGTLAVLNIVTGRRYGAIPDEVIQYAAGYYGEPPAPIDVNVMDRIRAAPRAKEIFDNPPPEPSLAELKKQHGTEDEDELILRALVPATDIARMRKSGPPARDFPMLSSPELRQVEKLMKVATAPVVRLQTEMSDVTLRR